MSFLMEVADGLVAETDIYQKVENEFKIVTSVAGAGNERYIVL